MLTHKHIATERLLIIIIMIVATFSRFWHFASIPFMHDEFSAIFRTWYNSVSEVIEIGVKQNDSHPAGVQLFLYFWIKLFGLSEPVLKLPFTLLGTASVFMVWLVARKWFNINTALFTAAIMAVTQYFIYYSQLARPYAPGLFFSLATAWFWTKVVFDNNPKKQDWLWFVLLMAINNYIHAFTLFFDLLVAATGLLFVKGKRLRLYLLAGLAILLLYLPGISVFLAQLGRGDIGGWLSKPKPDFLLTFIQYVFHFSNWFLATVVTIVLYLSIKYYAHSGKKNKFRWIGLGWFLVTFLVAYLYSLWRSPIIQYSTLLFVFPFLLMVFFSFFDKMPNGTRWLSLALILFTGLFTLIVNRQHYVEMYRQGFDQIPAHVINDLKRYSGNNIAVVLQAPDTRMFDYYFEKYTEKPEYFKLEKRNDLSEVNRYLENHHADMLLFGWGDYASLNYLKALQVNFPYVVERLDWFNSEYWVLSKKKIATRYHNTEEETVLGSLKKSVIPSKSSYGKAIKLHSDSLALNKNAVLYATAVIKSDTIVPDASLVFDLRGAQRNSVFWSASPFDQFASQDSTFTVAVSLRVRDLPSIPKQGILKFYIWKKDQTVIHVDKMEVGLSRIYPSEMGLYEPFR